MALSIPDLSTPLFSFFSDPPDNIQDCAQKWADAMFAYVNLKLNPLPLNTVAAREAFVPLLVLAFTSSNSNTGDCNSLAIENAFKYFTAILAEGMVTSSTPAGTVVEAVAPPLYIGFCDITREHTNHGAAALEFAIEIDTWMKTGTALVQVSPPPANPVSINWS